MLSSLPIDPKFTCPACGLHEPKVVLFCSRCWWLIPTLDRGQLRSMAIQGFPTKDKMAKCVRIVRKKLGLHGGKLDEHKVQADVATILPTQEVPVDHAYD